MKMVRDWLLRVVLVLFSVVAAAEPAVVSIDCRNPGAVVSSNMLGISCETSLMLSNGYFRATNKPLVMLFRTLGIQSLRIGGNSVDAEKVPVPSKAEVCSFFDFARAAGVKVIYSVRLKDGDPAATAAMARLIHDRYADVLDCFAIGNEPYYYKDYSVYTNKWVTLRDAILSVYPGATFCGPDQNPNPVLISNMARDFGNSAGRLVKITQHNYPFGCAYKSFKQIDITKLDPVDGTRTTNGSPGLIPQEIQPSLEKMLAPRAYEDYAKQLHDIRDAIEGRNVGFRWTEVNSYWFSGLKGVSDRYAAALWGTDYLHWWALHGADGVNFHTGDRTGGTVTLPCQYAAFVSSMNGYEVRPLGYGMKLFSLGSHGAVLPVTHSAEGIVAYAVMDADNTVIVTLINKNHGPQATNTNVTLRLNTRLGWRDPRMIFLLSRHGDLADTTTNITLGGASIAENGTWSGKWTRSKPADARQGILTLSMPPASAAVVKVTVRLPER